MLYSCFQASVHCWFCSSNKIDKYIFMLFMNTVAHSNTIITPKTASILSSCYQNSVWRKQEQPQILPTFITAPTSPAFITALTSQGTKIKPV